MPKWVNFAGRTTTYLDGNLGTDVPVDLVSVLVIGTAAKGTPEQIYTVTSKAAAKDVFGTEGTLLQGMYEAYEGGAPMVRLYRIGGTVASVTGIGGAITLRTIDREVGILDGYRGAWDGTTLTVWREDTSTSGTKVYEADFSGINPAITTDLGEVTATKTTALDPGASTFGGTGFSTAEVLADLVVAGVVVTDATDGVDMTRRELYEALNEAYKNLENYNLHFIHPMDVYLDDYNIADLPDDLSEGTTAEEYFGTDDYLGYLAVAEADDGTTTYTWSDTYVEDTNHEVNFAYQLANFCYQMSYNELSVHGIIDVLPPASMAQADVAAWVGKAPTIVDDAITVNGTGLLGNKFMAGTTSQSAGFWATESEWLDDPSTEQDPNGNDIDIGRHLSVFASVVNIVNPYARLVNRNSVSYIASGGAFYSGLLSKLSPSRAPSYQVMPPTISIPYSVAKTKLNDMAGYHYIVLRPTESGWRIADGWTAAQNTSDYRRFSTFNIIKYCDREIRKIVDQYIGVGMTTQVRESLKAKLENRFKDIISEGIIQSKTFTVTATALEAANGLLYIFADIVPAFELRQVSLFIAVHTA